MISLGRDSRTYHYRDSLKDLGCRFDYDSKCWLAPAERHSEAMRIITGRPSSSFLERMRDSIPAPPLHLVEENPPPPKKKHPPTDEQALLLHTYGTASQDIIGNAYAGTGKTSTLEMLAAAFPGDRFLYLVFNKKNADEARARFPRNVTVLTAHGLAWRGLQMSDFPKKQPQNGYDYSKIFHHICRGTESLPGIVPKQYIDILREVVSRFEGSNADEVDLSPRMVQILSVLFIASSVSLSEMRSDIVRFCANAGVAQTFYATMIDNIEGIWTKQRNVMKALKDTDGSILSAFIGRHEDANGAEGLDAFLYQTEDHAREYFRILSDFSNEVPMGHGTYLKIYQLKKPIIEGFTSVLFDEAQDANPVMLDIVMRQSMRKIWVGDRHQAIYQFNGAVNTIDNLIGSGAAVVPLTRSFRFGPPVADLGNRVLALKYRFHSEKYPSGSIGKITGAGTSAGEGRRVILCRSNAGVLEAALAASGPVYFGDCLPVEFLQIMLDIHEIGQNRHPIRKDSPYHRFNSLDDLEIEAEISRDIEATRAIAILDRYGAETFKRSVEALLLSSRSGPEAPLHIITAHKAKGLEWSHVRIADDFVSRFFGRDKETQELKERSVVGEDEINLLYVAVTRAMVSVSLPIEIEEMLEV